MEKTTSVFEKLNFISSQKKSNVVISRMLLTWLRFSMHDFDFQAVTFQLLFFSGLGYRSVTTHFTPLLHFLLFSLLP